MLDRNYSCGTNCGLRKCVVYGNEVTRAEAEKFTESLHATGWCPAAWAWDDRSDLGRALHMLPGAVAALSQAVVLALPMVVPDARDVRSRTTLLKLAAGGELVGVQMHLLTGPVLTGPDARDEVDHALKVLLREVLALHEAVLAGLSVGGDSAEEALRAWTGAAAQAGPVAGGAAAPAAPAQPGAEVVPLVGRHTGRYLEQRERLSLVGVHLPPLPDPQAPWHQRRIQIGRLADRLFGTWYDWQIARLLNENGVRTHTGCTFYPQLVAYYRRAYGRKAA
jgi:hypothetical protein